jgi:hypothetical protein
MSIVRNTVIAWIILFINLNVSETFARGNDDATTVYHNGTMIVASFDRDYIVIGTDGRGNRRVNDAGNGATENCKIEALGDHNFFSQAGVQFAIPPGSDQASFDGLDIAKRLFSINSSIKQYASAWEVEMESEYAKLLLAEPNNPYWKTDQTMTVGIFGGMDGNELGITTETINWVATLRGFSHEEEALTPQPKKWAIWGTLPKIAPYRDEFLQASTERAMAARSELQKYVKDHNLSLIDERGKFAEGLIRFTIINSVGTIPEIGFPISVLIAEKGKDIKWSAQAQSCAIRSRR